MSALALEVADDLEVVRDACAEALADWDMQAAIDDVKLVMTELATNAIKYGKPEVTAFLCRLAKDRVWGAVADLGPAMPEVNPALALDELDFETLDLEAIERAESGRGLFLVSSYTANWGVAPTGKGGKLVWFIILCAEAAT